MSWRVSSFVQKAKHKPEYPPPTPQTPTTARKRKARCPIFDTPYSGRNVISSLALGQSARSCPLIIVFRFQFVVLIYASVFNNQVTFVLTPESRFDVYIPPPSNTDPPLCFATFVILIIPPLRLLYIYLFSPGLYLNFQPLRWWFHYAWSWCECVRLVIIELIKIDYFEPFEWKETENNLDLVWVRWDQ